MNVKNETILTKDDIQDAMLKIAKVNKKFNITTFIIIGISFVAVTIINIINGASWETALINVCLGILFVLFFFIVFGVPFFIKKASAKLTGGTTYSYLFEDESFNVHAVTSGSDNYSTVRYDSLFDVVENDKYIYLYINKVSVYIIRKEAFETDKEMICDFLLKYSKRKRMNKK